MRKSTAVLLAMLILISAVSGIWLIVVPSLERQQSLERQEEVIASIENIIDAVVPESAPEPLIVSVANEPETIITPEPVPPKEPAPIGTELGILTIERLDMKLPVVEGVTEELLKTALGHVPETAAIGDIGNAVIAGHRSYTYGLFFNRLGEVEIGDIICVTSADGEVFTFEVFEIIEIEPDDQIAFVQSADSSIITLYTCTPIYKATHRLLVRAEKR